MSSQVIAAIIPAGVSVLTLIGTLAAQVFGRRATSRDTQKALEEQRKQLDRTLAEQRTRTLNERYATAAEQLGGDKPPAVRLAGVYAMAGLADDWEKNRQTLVDVLCANLRMPYEPDPGRDGPAPQRLAFQAVREVRHTIIRVITAHLKDDATESWQDLNFNFTGVVFDGGDFSGAKFSRGMVDFSGAEFSGGTVSFMGAEFSGGTVDFNFAKFSGSKVNFINSHFSGGTVDFSRAEFASGEVYFGVAEIGGAEFGGSTVDFSRAQFSGSKVAFSGQFSGGTVGFGGVMFSRGTISFRDAEFSGGTVDFPFAKFSGSEVNFINSQFSGGQVDFSRVSDWSFPPIFPWTNTPPLGVKLSNKEDQSRE